MDEEQDGANRTGSKSRIKSGWSQDVIDHNTKVLLAEGKTGYRARRIAYNRARVAYRKKNKTGRFPSHLSQGN